MGSIRITPWTGKKGILIFIDEFSNLIGKVGFSL